MGDAGTTIIAIVGIGVTVVNGLGLYILVGIRAELRAVKTDMKADIEKVWRRVFRHQHEIICANNECHPIRTGGVIVPLDTD